MLKNFFGLFQSRSDRLYSFGRPGRVYIIPTRLGLYVGFFCFSFLGIAYVYQNNLLYLYVFLVFSCYVTAMVYCNRNTKAMHINSVAVMPFFSDLQGTARLLVGRSGGAMSRNAEVFFGPSVISEIPIIRNGTDQYVDVSLIESKRGLHRLPKVILQSRFPFGFFQSWKVERPEYSYYVYPAKIGVIEFPNFPIEENSEGEAKRKGREEDFIGHQNWNSSMSFRRIDWKVKARTGRLMVQQFDGGDQGPVYLPWEATSFVSDQEKRICQLSLWVDRAAISGRPYLVRVKGWSSGWGRGIEHGHTCWKYLSTLTEDQL